MKLLSIYVREGLLYGKDELKKMLGFSDSASDKEKFVKCIDELTRGRYLKTKKTSDSSVENASLIDDDDDDWVGNMPLGSDQAYLFRFVGILYSQGRIIYVYPKYISSTAEPKEQMKTVIKVLLKYDSVNEKVVHFYSGNEGNKEVNPLSVMLFLLDDYLENDLYANEEQVIEINGDGDLLWQKTIDETYPIIYENRPYYTEIFTRKNIYDDFDFFHRLHSSIVTICSKELENQGLADMFSLSTVELSQEEIKDFGSDDYILSRIDAEMSQQFDDRKLLLLKAMAAFVGLDDKIAWGDSALVLIGTRSYHAVWEQVCAEVLQSQKKKKLMDIEAESSFSIDYSAISPAFQNTELVQLISKPRWHILAYAFGLSSAKDLESEKTLNPDYLRFYRNPSTGELIYYILDAKYYCPNFKGTKAKRIPGVEDIAKQYLYFLAYKRFLEAHSIQEVRNYFLMPKETGTIENAGKVELNIWDKKYVPNDIGIRVLPADMMYEKYLQYPTGSISLDTLD